MVVLICSAPRFFPFFSHRFRRMHDEMKVRLQEFSKRLVRGLASVRGFEPRRTERKMEICQAANRLCVQGETG